MNDLKVKRQRLRRILADVHRRKQAGLPQPSPAWRKKVMGSIPASNGPAARIDPWLAMERLVWRFVPVAGALALLLAIMVIQVGSDATVEVVRVMSADTADSGLYTFYQSESRNE